MPAAREVTTGREAVPREQLSRFLQRLDTRCRYAIVKNADLWESLRRGGDWDIAVSDLAAAQGVLLEVLGPPRRVAPRSYVVAHYYDWGEIDLLPCLVWQGVELIPTQRFMERARRNEAEWMVACPAHQAIMGWAAPLLAHGSYRQKYESLVAMAVAYDGEEFALALSRLFGSSLGNRLHNLACGGRLDSSTELAASMRSMARCRAYSREPWRAGSRTLAFGYQELRLRSSPCLPFLHLRSTTDVRAAGLWCNTHKKVIPGLALFDGGGVRRWSSEDNGIGGTSASSARGDAGRGITVAERVELSNLQAAGWLAGTTVAIRGARGSRSAAVGKPRLVSGPTSSLAEFLDSQLARHVARSLVLHVD